MEAFAELEPMFTAVSDWPDGKWELEVSFLYRYPWFDGRGRSNESTFAHSGLWDGNYFWGEAAGKQKGVRLYGAPLTVPRG